MRTKRPCRCSGVKAKHCLLLCESIFQCGGRLWQLPGSGSYTAAHIRLPFEKSNGILYASMSAYWRGEGCAELARSDRNLHRCPPPAFLGGWIYRSVPLIVQTITNTISTDISLPYLPPGIPWGLSPSPLSAQSRQGAAQPPAFLHICSTLRHAAGAGPLLAICPQWAAPRYSEALSNPDSACTVLLHSKQLFHFRSHTPWSPSK